MTMNIFASSRLFYYSGKKNRKRLIFDVPATRCVAFLEVDTPNTSHPPCLNERSHWPHAP